MYAYVARLLLVALCGAAAAAGQRFAFRAYTADEGLENRVINAILQDREGYLWVGTQAGAFRYDGTRFRAFQRADGLLGDNVHGLRETTDGTLWVYTEAGPAFRVGDRFEPLHGAGTDEHPGAVWPQPDGPGPRRGTLHGHPGWPDGPAPAVPGILDPPNGYPARTAWCTGCTWRAIGPSGSAAGTASAA